MLGQKKIARKPVMALMGEFSAGKSTLANLLLGEGRSPVKVTATQLPPVWFSHGDGQSYAVDLQGEHTPVALNEMESVSVADTSHIRIFMKSEILEIMDIIDMPGNSDPNMSPEVWQRALHHADGVIWCTHATQAWRQSEAAVWDDLPVELQENSLLLLTRFDKILNETDGARVLRRVKSETDGLFRGVFPVSLTQAMGAGDDIDAWNASGAEQFTQALLEIVLGVGGKVDAEANAPIPLRPAPEASAGSVVMPRRVAVSSDDANSTRPVRDIRRPVA